MSEHLNELSFLKNQNGELFNRKFEQQALLDAFERCCSCDQKLSPSRHRKKEFVLISGQSGTGKTCLAETLKSVVTSSTPQRRGGYFIRGKFDQIQRPEPFAPLVAAFTEFANHVLQKDPQHIQSVKERIKEEVALELRLLLDTIPALGRILGPRAGCYSSEASARNTSEPQKDLQIMIRNLVRAISSPTCPLVILIDDLQWSDAGTLSLLEAFITDQASTGVLIVGTCRDNEVKRGHEVARMLRRMEDDKTAHIFNIELFNLDEKSVNVYLSSTLKLSPGTTLPLAEFIYKKTGGNFYFILEMIKFLYEEGILYMYPGTSVWEWDKIEIESAVRDSVVNGIDELESTKMEQLPPKVKDVIRMAACIGAEFEKYLLTSLLPRDQVDHALEVAEEKYLIAKVDFSCPDNSGDNGNDSGHHGGWYRFTHDRIQEGASSLIRKEDRSRYHLWFGRTLHDKLTENEINKNIYLVLNQLIQGIELIDTQEEKNQVALLCLRAGQKSIKCFDFATASRYLKVGIDLLAQRHWRDEYHLSLELYNSAAEVECCLTNVERMNILIDEIIDNSRSLCDLMRAVATRVYSLSNRHELEKALWLGFDFLRQLGETFPKKGNTVTILSEMFRTKYMLRGVTDDEIMKLPRMVDPMKVCAMQMLSMIYTSCILYRKDLLPLIAFRMVQLTLKHGLLGASSTAFALYGHLISQFPFFEIDKASRYSQLAVSIVEKFQQREFLSKIYFITYGFISPWKDPPSQYLPPLYDAMHVGFNTGDSEYGCSCGIRYYILSFFSGVQNLDTLEKEIRVLDSALISYHTHVTGSFMPLFQVIQILLGKSSTDNPAILKGEMYDAELGLEQEKDAPYHLAFIWFMRAFLAYYFNDYELAGQMFTEGPPVSSGSTVICEQHFYSGLTSLALAQKGIEKRKHTHKAHQSLKKLKKLRRHSPNLLTTKLFLLEAEIEVVKGDAPKALAKFEAAIDSSKSRSMASEWAIACERAHLACLHFGDERRSLDFATQAKSAYEAWGAHAKVKQMENFVASAQS